MVRKFAMVAACLTAGLFVVSSLMAADDKTPTIEEIMKKVPNKGRNKGLAAQCADAAAAGKWEDCQKMAAELKTLGDALGKNPCPKGDKASWEKLTKGFSANMETIEKGAKAKDAAEVKKGLDAFTKSCKTCHDSHRG
jgi:Cytochrome C'